MKRTRNHPRVVEQLDERALLVDSFDVELSELTRGGVSDGLAFVLRGDGRLNHSKRRQHPTLVIARDLLVDLVADVVAAGAVADRELAFEIGTAIELGLERARKAAIA